jgi:hypothetical protein
LLCEPFAPIQPLMLALTLPPFHPPMLADPAFNAFSICLRLPITVRIQST